MPKNISPRIAAFFVASLLAFPARAADLEVVSGPLVVAPKRRPALPADHPWACSNKLPLCVHAPSAALASEIFPTLRDLESVAAHLHRTLRWPDPVRDNARGGSAAFDVYLTPTPAPFFEVVPDDPDGWTLWDSTSAFALLQPGLPNACFRSSVLAEAYARAALYGLDAGGNDGAANATAAYVATQVVHCPVSWMADVDDVQTAPQRAITNTTIHGGRGNLLFPWFLQDSRGVDGSVDLLHALWAMSLQHTPASSRRFVNEPDLFDVLVRLDDGRAPSLDALLLEYAITRVFAGNRDDGLYLPDSRYLGAAGAVRFDVSLPWSALPRSVGSTVPIEPTGSSYVWLDLTSAPKDAGLIIQARWEVPTLFRFSFLRVGNDGSPVSRLDPPSLQREPELQVTIENVSGVAGLLIVASNAGPNLSDFAFDPDAIPYSPSAYSLALYPKK